MFRDDGVWRIMTSRAVTLFERCIGVIEILRDSCHRITGTGEGRVGSLKESNSGNNDMTVRIGYCGDIRLLLALTPGVQTRQDQGPFKPGIASKN